MNETASIQVSQKLVAPVVGPCPGRYVIDVLFYVLAENVSALSYTWPSVLCVVNHKNQVVGIIT